MKVLKTAVKIVAVVAAVAVTISSLGLGAPLGVGILGATWGGIAAASALVYAGLEMLSPTPPRTGSVIGSATSWALRGAPA